MISVVRNAENLTFRGVEAEIKRLALKVLERQCTVDDMRGRIFTITNSRESVGFLVAVKEALENPLELLMGGNVKKALEL